MGAMPNKTDRNDARGDRADHAHWLVPGGTCEGSVLPIVACAADRAADGAE
jgi:hypothetical protein